MHRTSVALSAVLIAFLSVAILGGLVWANTIFVRSKPVEKDFLIPWLGARTFLQYGESPYGTPATQRAQIIYYGRLAAEGQDPLLLRLPFPVEIFFFPIALIPDYSLAMAIWMTCLEIALVALGFLSVRLTGWKPGRVFLPLVLLFPLIWVYGAFSVVSGNVSGFIALATAGFILALKREREELAGGLLILLVCAPRLTGVLAFFIIWWIIYHHRWRVIWGFLMGAAVLIGLAFLFMPDWIQQFLRILLSHGSFSPGLTSIAIFSSWSPVVGVRLGWVLAAGLLLVLFFVWGNILAKDFRNFLWTVCLTLSATPLLGIPLIPREFPFLYVPLMLFLAILAEGRPWEKQWHISGIVTVVILVGFWILTFNLFKARAFSVLDDVLFLLMPIVLVTGLTWVRWWFIHAKPTGLENPP